MIILDYVKVSHTDHHHHRGDSTLHLWEGPHGLCQGESYWPPPHLWGQHTLREDLPGFCQGESYWTSPWRQHTPTQGRSSWALSRLVILTTTVEETAHSISEKILLDSVKVSHIDHSCETAPSISEKILLDFVKVSHIDHSCETAPSISEKILLDFVKVSHSYASTAMRTGHSISESNYPLYVSNL